MRRRVRQEAQLVSVCRKWRRRPPSTQRTASVTPRRPQARCVPGYTDGLRYQHRNCRFCHQRPAPPCSSRTFLRRCRTDARYARRSPNEPPGPPTILRDTIKPFRSVAIAASAMPLRGSAARGSGRCGAQCRAADSRRLLGAYGAKRSAARRGARSAGAARLWRRGAARRR